MNHRSILVTTLLAVALITACSDDTESPPATGRLIVKLTDAPAAYEEVNITFSQIDISMNGGWISVFTDTARTVNLLDWNNGKSVELGRKDLDPGKVTQIRLIVDRASVKVDGTTHPLDVPSGEQSGLKLNTNFDIESSITYVLILDFDAQQSIVTTGPPNNPNGYKLTPVIRAVGEANTGVISAIVENNEHYPVAKAIDSQGMEVTSTAAEKNTGAFSLAFLPPDTYTIVVEDTLGQSHTSTNVALTVGEQKLLGNLELQ